MPLHPEQDPKVRRRRNDEPDRPPQRLCHTQALITFFGCGHEERGGQTDEALDERVWVAEGESVQGEAEAEAGASVEESGGEVHEDGG